MYLKDEIWLFANHNAPCTAIWQQPLQSVLALRSCIARDLILIIIIITQNCYSTIYLPVVRHKELENKSPNDVKMTNSESLLNKNYYSVSEHTHDENEWEISVIAKDIAIKKEYYDAKNLEIIVSEQEYSIILKFIWLRATHCEPEQYTSADLHECVVSKF